MKNPGAASTATGANRVNEMNIQTHSTTFKNRRATTLPVRIDGHEKPETFTGRPAWLLEKLIAAGSTGLTTAELPPGVRCSHYILLLRKAGVDIVTLQEMHTGIYAGRHSRYVLRSKVEIVRDGPAAVAA
jgi:hypothetical protein